MNITSPFRTALNTVLIVAGMVAVFGCASQPGPRPAPAPAAAGPAASGLVGQSSLPAPVAAVDMLTTSAVSLRQGWYLSRAQQQLVSRCMDRLGLRYLVSNPGPEPAIQATTSQVLGVRLPATYGVSLGGAGSTSLPAEDRYTEELPKAELSSYIEALSGPPRMSGTLVLPSGVTFAYETGGCVGDGRRTLFGSVAAALADALVPQDIGNTFLASLAKNAAYGAARQSWQRCMAAAGWHYASPQASIMAIQDLAADAGTKPATLSAQQSRVASADVACDGRSHLRATMASALAAFVRALPHPELVQLQRVYLDRQHAVQTAIQDLAR